MRYFVFFVMANLGWYGAVSETLSLIIINYNVILIMSLDIFPSKFFPSYTEWCCVGNVFIFGCHDLYS